MSGAELAVGEQLVGGYLLAVARVAGFVLVAPPFATRSIPAQARAAVALAMGLPLAAVLAAPGRDLVSLSAPEVAMQGVLQVLTGVLLGFFVLVAVSTVQAVGDYLDVMGGFSISAALDPLMMTQTSVMGRLHGLVAATLLFVGDGHLWVLQGLSRSLQEMPDPRIDLAATAAALTDDVVHLVVAALQIAGPVLAALMLADVALGLLTRAAPALNAFALAYPLKILLTLLLVGLILVQLPAALRVLVQDAAASMLQLTGVG